MGVIRTCQEPYYAVDIDGGCKAFFQIKWYQLVLDTKRGRLSAFHLMVMRFVGWGDSDGARENRIKIIIPDTYENYESGNGEPCFVLVDNETKKSSLKMYSVAYGLEYSTTTVGLIPVLFLVPKLLLKCVAKITPLQRGSGLRACRKTQPVLSAARSLGLSGTKITAIRFIVPAAINSVRRERLRRRTTFHMTELSIDGKSLKVKNGNDFLYAYITDETMCFRPANAPSKTSFAFRKPPLSTMMS